MSEGFDHPTNLDLDLSTPCQRLPNSQTDFHSFKDTNIFASPLANVALHYGSSFIGSRKRSLQNELSNISLIPKLQQYFCVNLDYVKKKLFLIVFPWPSGNEWDVIYLENRRVVPMKNVNAPDLYIPLMAYLTYIFVENSYLGIADRFSPEALWMIASQGLAWTLAEVIIQWMTLYITHIQSTLSCFDLLAYSGYKFVSISLSCVMKIVKWPEGYILGVAYFGLSNAFFVIKTLKWRTITQQEVISDFKTEPISSKAFKRKTYFLLLTGVMNIFQIFWISKNSVK